jgi:hypothetical protein
MQGFFNIGLCALEKNFSCLRRNGRNDKITQVLGFLKSGSRYHGQ